MVGADGVVDADPVAAALDGRRCGEDHAWGEPGHRPGGRPGDRARARLRDGFYGLDATLLTLVFLALLGEPRATAPPGCRRARWTWIGPRRSRRSAASSSSSPSRQSRRADHGAGAPSRRRPPPCPRVLDMDGHARAYFVTRQVQKTHVARLRFPAPAIKEDLGHRSGRRAGVHADRRAIGLPGRRTASPAPGFARHRRREPRGDGLLRPRRLVTRAVCRLSRRRVRPAHLPQRPRA